VDISYCKLFIIFLLLSSAAAFIPVKAYANQISYAPITLEKLVEDSGLIVEAQRMESNDTSENIPIDPDTKKYPPLKKVLQAYKIVDILYAKDNLLPSGKIILVEPANFYTNLEVHKKFYLENISQSPIYQNYSPKRDGLAKGDKTIILFLLSSTTKNSLKYTAQASYESIDSKKLIIELIKTKGSIL